MNANLTKSLDKVAMILGIVLFFGVMMRRTQGVFGCGDELSSWDGCLAFFLSTSYSSFWRPLPVCTPA